MPQRDPNSEMTSSSTALPIRTTDRNAPWSLRGIRTEWPLIGGFVLLLLVAAGAIWLFVNAHRFNEAVAHTLQVRSDAYRLLTLVQDAETGQRGFIITEDPSYLDPYEAGAANAPRALQDLRRLTANSPAQRAAIARLDTAMSGKLRELALTVGLMKQGNSAAAIARVKQNVGNALMETVRDEVGNIEAEEERVQTQQANAAEMTNKLLGAATFASILIILALAGYAIAATGRATRNLVAAQDALRENNENLESLVAERVSELQMANEEIQRFAYIVSHDLRAPLVNVMGFTSELDAVRGDIKTFIDKVEAQVPGLVTEDLKTSIATDLPEALGFIRTSTAKMDRLINAILKLSREGRRVLTPQDIDVVALVRAQGESLSQQLTAADADLVIDERMPPIVSDRLAIEQIFGNLIENATKYLASGRPGHIAVSASRHGDDVRYDIADNGRGIEEKDFERVFELFRRSGEQDKPGEGIGLAYVRNLARRLGGNVTVKSQFGVGSTFTVTLPATFKTKARAK